MRPGAVIYATHPGGHGDLQGTDRVLLFFLAIAMYNRHCSAVAL